MIKKLDFTKGELDIIERVMGVPLKAYGLKRLLEETNFTEDECKEIYYSLQNGRRNALPTNDILIKSEDLIKLSLMFEISSNIIGPEEMNTIVGHTWSEAMAVSKKIHTLISQ